MNNTPATSWAMADAWASRANDLNPLLGIGVLSALPGLGFALTADLSLRSNVLLVVGVPLFAYLLLSVVLYLGLQSDPEWSPPEEQPLDTDGSFGSLIETARTFGDGLSIEHDAWRLFNDRGTMSAVAVMAMDGSTSLVVIGDVDSDDSGADIILGFYGRQSNGRALVSSFAHPPFPLRDADVFFDARASAFGLWRSHIERIGQTGPPFTVDDYVSLISAKNPVKLAGFRRLALTWGHAVWRRRGVVKGFGTSAA